VKTNKKYLNVFGSHLSGIFGFQRISLKHSLVFHGVNYQKRFPFPIRATPCTIRVLGFKKRFKSPFQLGICLFGIEMREGVERLIERHRASPPAATFLDVVQGPDSQSN
jgi:hypothetical protein